MAPHAPLLESASVTGRTKTGLPVVYVMGGIIWIARVAVAHESTIVSTQVIVKGATLG
jgi:hypothetical protein